MAVVQNLNIKDAGRAQLTFTATISQLASGLTPEFPLPPGIVAWTAIVTLAGAGSLQMQKSCNDPGEAQDQRSGTAIPQLWANVGTASTAGSVVAIDGTGSPSMLRGSVTGGAGTDILTICISASGY